MMVVVVAVDTVEAEVMTGGVVAVAVEVIKELQRTGEDRLQQRTRHGGKLVLQTVQQDGVHIVRHQLV